MDEEIPTWERSGREVLQSVLALDERALRTSGAVVQALCDDPKVRYENVYDRLRDLLARSVDLDQEVTELSRELVETMRARGELEAWSESCWLGLAAALSAAVGRDTWDEPLRKVALLPLTLSEQIPGWLGEEWLELLVENTRNLGFVAAVESVRLLAGGETDEEPPTT